MKRQLLLFLAFLLLTLPAAGQSAKPWTDLSRKESEKLLNDSAWGRTQTDTDTREMMYSPTVTPTSNSRNPNVNSDSSRSEQGASNQAQSVKYRIRFLSARPIREAFSSIIVQMTQGPKDELTAQMQTFVDRDFGDYIVVSVTVESSDRRFSGPVEQLLASSTGETLKNSTYLERKDGKRIFLMDYRPAGKDGLGSKFVFKRTLDGTPFLTPDSGSVRFVSEIGTKIKMDMKFKISEMLYNGKLEY